MLLRLSSLMTIISMALTMGFAGHCTTPSSGNATMSVSGATKNMTYRGAQTPSKWYVAALNKVELMKSATDTDPAVLYDDTSSGKGTVVNFASTTPISITSGSISEKRAGTYTHIRLKIMAIGQEIATYYSGVAGTSRYIKLYQDFDNSIIKTQGIPQALIKKGDFLLNNSTSGQMEWFNLAATTKAVTYYSTRPTTPNPFTKTIATGEETQTIALTSSFTVEAGKAYSATITFDVTNTFDWNDINSNTQFEPVSSDNTGLENGIDVDVKMPAITFTVQ